MKKSERDQTILSVCQFIAEGKSQHTIIRMLREGAKYTRQVAENLYNAAVEKIRFGGSTPDKEMHRDIILFQYGQLYDEAYAAKKHGVCMQILDKEAELLGLKTTNINVTGEVSEGTATTLIESLQMIMIVMDKGMGNVLEQSIAAALRIEDKSESSDSGSLPE